MARRSKAGSGAGKTAGARKKSREQASVKIKRGARGAAKRSRAAAKYRPSESERFVRDLVVRGEATTPDKCGKLPLDATHVIKKVNPDGTVEVERVRLKAF